MVFVLAAHTYTSRVSVCSSEEGLLANLPNSSLSESSIWTDNINSLDATRSRLHTPQYGNVHSGGWRARTSTLGEWIQADLLETVYIYRVDTQGKQAQFNQWTKTFQIKHSLSSGESSFEYVRSSPGGAVLTFNGNYDTNTVVTNEFPARNARFVRVYPRTWRNAMVLRWEVYGCAED